MSYIVTAHTLHHLPPKMKAWALAQLSKPAR